MNIKNILVAFTKDIIENNCDYNRYKDYDDVIVETDKNEVSLDYRYKVKISCKGFHFDFFTFKIRQTLLILKDTEKLVESIKDQWKDVNIERKIESMVW